MLKWRQNLSEEFASCHLKASGGWQRSRVLWYRKEIKTVNQEMDNEGTKSHTKLEGSMGKGVQRFPGMSQKNMKAKWLLTSLGHSPSLPTSS